MTSLLSLFVIIPENFILIPTSIRHQECKLISDMRRHNLDVGLVVFWVKLKERGYMPRYNGKVERNHRKDNESFYATYLFYSFEEFATLLKGCN